MYEVRWKAGDVDHAVVDKLQTAVTDAMTKAGPPTTSPRKAQRATTCLQADMN
jgi:hypothetical protein